MRAALYIERDRSHDTPCALPMGIFYRGEFVCTSANALVCVRAQRACAYACACVSRGWFQRQSACSHFHRWRADLDNVDPVFHSRAILLIRSNVAGFAFVIAGLNSGQNLAHLINELYLPSGTQWINDSSIDIRISNKRNYENAWRRRWKSFIHRYGGNWSYLFLVKDYNKIIDFKFILSRIITKCIKIRGSFPNIIFQISIFQHQICGCNNQESNRPLSVVNYKYFDSGVLNILLCIFNRKM